MIISLRGTNGSGKSFIVKKILKQYPSIKAFMLPNKKKPAGYICELETKRLFVLGHYEIANGGIDTIGNLETVYSLISSFHELGCDILYEGMNMSDSVETLIRFYRADLDIRVVFIDHPLDACIKSVKSRGHKISDKTITSIFNKCNNQFLRLTKAGVRCKKLRRKDAYKQIEQWLGVKDDHHKSPKRMPDFTADDQLPA